MSSTVKESGWIAFRNLLMASAIQAVEDSGIDFSKEDPYRAGVLIGTGIGGLQEIEEQHIRLLEKGPSKVSPFCVPKLMSNAASGSVSIRYGLCGPNMCAVSACASGSHAIGEAFYMIRGGRSDIMVTGGSEAALTPIGLASFCSLKSLSTRNDAPGEASRPFDRDRNGFVLSEGAAVMVIEEYEHAKNRGANIYAEILGYAAAGDGYHITAPHPSGRGAAKTMQLALESAHINPEDVDYINAHGTSTQLNDLAETAAISMVFGDHCKNIRLNSNKSSLGHTLGASGAIELLTAAKTIKQSVITPTLNLDNVDPKCDYGIDFVAKEARQTEVKVAISNSFGFGGHNACVVIGKV